MTVELSRLIRWVGGGESCRVGVGNEGTWWEYLVDKCDMGVWVFLAFSFPPSSGRECISKLMEETKLVATY